MDDFSIIRVPKDQMTLLSAPISRGPALDKVVQGVDDLDRDISRLKYQQAHDPLVLLKNSLSIPRLL